MRRTVTAIAVLVAALVVAADTSRGDTFIMKDGKQIRGRIVKKIGVSWVQIKTEDARLLTLKRFDIVRHVEGDKPVPQQAGDGLAPESGSKIAEYRRRVEAIKDPNAGAHFELGKWCKTNGLVKTGDKEFEKTLEQDKDHEGARLALGYKLAILKGKKVWLKPDEAKVWEAERSFLAEAGRRKSAWQKAVRLTYSVDLDKPKGEDKQSMGNLEVRQVMALKYRVTNRTPFTLVFGRARRGRGGSSPERIAPGKTGRGEWRTWLYATAADQPDRTSRGRGSWNKFRAHGQDRTSLRARLEGKYVHPSAQVSIVLSYNLAGTRYFRRKANANEIAKLIKAEVTPFVGTAESKNRRRRKGEKEDKAGKAEKGEKAGKASKADKAGEGEKEE